jgi:hypothetical protein
MQSHHYEEPSCEKRTLDSNNDHDLWTADIG